MNAGKMRAAACLILSAMVPAQGQAQTAATPQCPGCTIELRQTVVLGTADGPGALPRYPTSIAVDSRGRIWLAFGLPELLVFSSEGRFLRTFGRRGGGPNEFMSASTLIAAGDSIVVFDDRALRATVVDPEFNSVRTIRIPAPAMAVHAARWPARVFMNADIRTASSAGWPLHSVDFSGSGAVVVKSFGLNRGEMRPRSQHLLLRSLAAGPGGTVWSAERWNYQAAQWNEDGGTLAIVTRAVNEFRSGTYGIGGPRTPPAARIQFVKSDQQGNLWTFMLLPARDWRAAWAGVDLPSGRGRAEVGASASPDVTKLFQTVIEVMDPAKRQLLARRTLERLPIPVGAGRLAFYAEDETGVPRISIVAAELRRSP